MVHPAHGDGRPYVVVSPHFDDAVFSCGNRLLRDAPAQMITVCGGLPPAKAAASSWDRRCGFTTGFGAAEARRLEDLAAAAVVGTKAVHLSFLDQPYQPDKDIEVIADALAEVIDRDAVMWVPSAIGGHYDHVATRDAALLVARRHSATVKLFADTPYASAKGWDTPDAERMERFRWAPQLRTLQDRGVKLGQEYRYRLTPEESVGKIALSRSYACQLCAMGEVTPRLSDVDGDLSIEVWWDCVLEA